MIDKRTRIIDAAIEMFAESGYHATTIKDIAEHAGIAKGGLYFYFKSKEELLIAAYKHYYELLFHDLTTADNRLIHPREKLIELLLNQFQQVTRHRSFIIMLIKEQTLRSNDEFQKFFHEMHYKMSEQLRFAIIAIYGEAILPHAWDITASLRSLIKEYTGLFITDHTHYNPRRTAEYMVNRLDDIAEGLIRRNEVPIITEEAVKRWLAHFGLDTESRRQQEMFAAIQEFKKALHDMAAGHRQNEQWLSALTVIEEELRAYKPRSVILRGMLALLEQDNEALIKPYNRLRQSLIASGVI